MKERIKGAFTKKKIFHFLKMALFVVALSLILLSLLGTVAHATGLVDDTINAENLYSKYPLSNYQLDFFVDNSWSWLPWNWLDGIGKSVQYGLYCITNFVWTISLYLSNATGYVVQEAYKLDFINDMADSIGKSIQTLAGVTENGFSSTGFYVGFLLLIILVVGMYVAYTGLIKRETSKALHAVINFVVVFVLSASFIAYAPDYIKKINEFSSDISTASLDLGTKIMLPNSDSEGKDSVDLIRDSLFSIQVERFGLFVYLLAGKQYWTESAERVGIIEKVMNDGSIGSTFNEGMMKVEGETAYCIDINTDFKNGYKTRADASSRMSADQISDVALSLKYVKQYGEAHKELNYKQVYLLEQCVVWQRLSVHLGWQCDNVRASYDEIPKATQDEVFSGAKAFVKENKGRYECGGYIYSGEGQELGQFWAKLNVGNAKLQKTSSNTSITNCNGNYSVAGAIYGVFSDKDCTKQLATLTTDENGNTDVVEVKAGTVYIKELSAPAGYKVDKTVYSLKIEAGKTATLNVSDTPKVTDTLIELFKIDMETQKDNPQGNASLAGAEFTWKYYAGFYTKDNLPAEATRTSFNGKQLVTFEELYDLSNPDEPKKVTEHNDIDDK